MMASALLTVLLELLTVWQGSVTVYVRHVRKHPSGAHARAHTLALQLSEGANAAGVDVADVTALDYAESGLDHARVSPVGAFGASQLMPGSRWARGYGAELRAHGQGHAEALNIVWGAYALRAGLEACGSLVAAYGHYRTGRCRAGPRARHTARLAEWIRARLMEEEGRS